MKNINRNAPFNCRMRMMQDRWGLWHFIEHPQRKPLTPDELETLQKASNCEWFLIMYPKEHLTEEQHNSFKINQYERG